MINNITPETDKIVFLHVPKTGGGFLEDYFYNQCKNNRNFFLSFNGLDDSRMYSDERSTDHPKGNKCVIESIFRTGKEETISRFKNSPHFKESKLIMGHTTVALEELFPEYKFRYIAVLREPILRTLSNFLQFSHYNSVKKECSFAKYTSKYKPLTFDYWNWIHDIIINNYPLDTLMIHENHYLSNCQTKILQGSRYQDKYEFPNLKKAKEQLDITYYSLFEDFNTGLQKNLNKLNLPIDMSDNGMGTKTPIPQTTKQNKYGDFYNAPQKMIDLVTEMNRVDIELYNYTRKRITE